ncbi:MAG: helix-turn-helix transcriptional regulator [Thaumarchaeota archaeon]|nr:helix-turn-helix transcriptional regulator [Nitrososphaerota archaeon]
MRDRMTEMHAEVCKTLGSPVRIEILESLRDGEKTVGQLSEELELRQANVSQHLAVLRQRQVVTTRREGTSTYYRVSNPKIIQACKLMGEVLLEQLKEAQSLTVLAGRTR